MQVPFILFIYLSKVFLATAMRSCTIDGTFYWNDWCLSYSYYFNDGMHLNPMKVPSNSSVSAFYASSPPSSPCESLLLLLLLPLLLFCLTVQLSFILPNLPATGLPTRGFPPLSAMTKTDYV